MKRLIYLLMAIMLLVSLAACNSNDANPTNDSTAPTTQTDGSKPNVTAPSDSTEPSGDVTEPDTQPSDPTEGTTAPSEPDVDPSEPEEDPSVPSEPSHEHSYTNVVTAPTCTEDGYTTYTCACGDSYVSDQVAAKGHSYTSKVTAPTCTAEGYTTFTCDCGDSYVGDKVNAKGHSYGAWVTVKEPTTSATGKAERKCSACSAKEERILDKIIEDHTHSYTPSVTKQPTCTAEGVKTYTCSCGGSYTESIAATGHNYTSKVTKQPTCSADGVKTYTCSKCNGSYTESIAKLSHNYSATVVKPTCTEKGYTKHTCKSCSHSYNDTYTNATGHSYTSNVTKAATCSAAGVKTFTCSKCGHSYTESIAKLSHKYTSKVTAPTCTDKGYTTYTCSKCSDSYKSNYKDALNHKNTKVKTQAAGCTTDGYTKVFCSDCGTLISSKVIPSNGSHAYETMRLNVAAKKNDAMYAEERKDTMYENWYTAKYGTWTDWNVQICRDCCEIDTSTIVFAYTPLEAAEIMMGYVNELREEVYGTDYYNLKLDPTLQELAEIRAKEIAENGMHANGTYTGAFEMKRDGGVTLYEQFVFWTDTAVEVDSLIDKSSIYFGYGKYEIHDTGDHSAGFYGIMLFWSDFDRSDYLYG